jgi:hypothetical protein
MTEPSGWMGNAAMFLVCGMAGVAVILVGHISPWVWYPTMAAVIAAAVFTDR